MALVSYKCPNCGGSVVFDPKKQKFCCEFCMSEFTKEEMEAAALKSTETSGTQEESSAADTAQNNNAGSTNQKRGCPGLYLPELRRGGRDGRNDGGNILLLLSQPGSAFRKAFRRIPAGLCDPLCHGQEESNGGYSLTGSRRKNISRTTSSRRTRSRSFLVCTSVPDVQLQGRRKDPGGRREEPDLGDGKYPLHGA